MTKTTEPVVPTTPPAVVSSLAPKPPVTPAAPALATSILFAPSHEIPEQVDPLLVNILAWPRCHDSENEKLFCAWLKKELNSKALLVTTHAEGAMSVTLPHPDGKPSTTLFSCHVDTIDADVKLGTRKKLTYDPNFGHISLDKGSPGTCLGADDGAGIWIMLHMIDAKVPGTYMFHRGEERGGISAKAIASKEGPWLKKFDLAVAFDRPRTNEIITHQGGIECASTKFAIALCAALSEHNMDYKPSTGGVYTDTKEYRRLISECINVGVGYEMQHGVNEFQDFAHLSALLTAVCAINWDALPAERDCTKETYLYGGNSYPFRRDYTQPDLLDDDPRFRNWGRALGADQKDKKNGKKSSTKTKTKLASIAPARAPVPTRGEEILESIEMGEFGIEDIRWICVEEPEEAASLVLALLRSNGALKGEVNALLTLIGS